MQPGWSVCERFQAKSESPLLALPAAGYPPDRFIELVTPSMLRLIDGS